MMLVLFSSSSGLLHLVLNLKNDHDADSASGTDHQHLLYSDFYLNEVTIITANMFLFFLFYLHVTDTHIMELFFSNITDGQENV